MQYLKKENLLGRISELQIHIETVKNRKTISKSTLTDVSSSDILGKIEDFGDKIIDIHTENKSLRERVKELEDDQSEMEDRIYYLEKKLYSLDAYATKNAKSQETVAQNMGLSSKNKNTAFTEICHVEDDRNSLTENKKNEIEQVRITGKKRVGKLKQYSIKRNIEFTCASIERIGYDREEANSEGNMTSINGNLLNDITSQEKVVMPSQYDTDQSVNEE